MSSIYGENAVTGTIEDAEKADIEITTNGQTEVVKQEDLVEKDDKVTESSEEQKEEQDTSNVDESKDNEDKHTDLREDVKKHEETVKEISESLGEKGVDFDAVKNEFDNEGGLSDETYTQLDKAGYPKNAVDMMLAGMEATAQKFANTVYEHAGGKKEFEGIQNFVKAQGQKEIDVFNRVMSSKDIDQVTMFVDGLKAKMSLKHGTNQTLVLGSQTTTNNVVGFRSVAEMTKAMGDPRYQTDSAYRADVQQKTINAKFM